MNELSVYEIASAFPDEILELAPRAINRINRTLKPYRSFFEQLERQPYDRWTKDFITEVVRVCYMPKAELKHLGRLRKMIKIVKNKANGLLNGVRPDEIARAKEVRIESFLEGKRKGKKFWSKCPFHNEKTPSFVVNADNTGHCFSCNWHGDSIAFIMKLQNVRFLEAVRFLNA